MKGLNLIRRLLIITLRRFNAKKSLERSNESIQRLLKRMQKKINKISLLKNIIIILNDIRNQLTKTNIVRIVLKNAIDKHSKLESIRISNTLKIR